MKIVIILQNKSYDYQKGLLAGLIEVEEVTFRFSYNYHFKFLQE
jgi:hypothetical protein